MGIEPYFLASGVLGIVAQRLVPRICPHCQTTLPVPAGAQHLFGDQVPDALHRGVGCANCRNTGFSGRIGIYELLRMTHSMRELILSHASEHAILEVAMQEGTSMLREQCLERVREGQTTLEEVIRVT